MLNSIKTGSSKNLRTPSLTETPVPIPYNATEMPGASLLGEDGDIYFSVKDHTSGVYVWQKPSAMTDSPTLYDLTNTDEIFIYVNHTALDRPLEEMQRFPPVTPEYAIPTLARASEFANALIGAEDVTAVIMMAPGLYDPASIWECNVKFRSCDPTQEGWPMFFPEDIIGDATTNNNFFDGSGYGDVTTRVNFQTWTFALDWRATAVAVHMVGRTMTFTRSVAFHGGFHFLGISDLIKAVADGNLSEEAFITGSVELPPGSFTTDTSANTPNVNTFLNQLRIANSRTPTYSPWTNITPIRLGGDSKSVSNIQGIVFGPGLPSRKDGGNDTRAPYIATAGETQLNIANIYFRGATTIDSAACGVTNTLQWADKIHYGSEVIDAPWIWRQSYHTFLGTGGSEVGWTRQARNLLINRLGSNNQAFRYFMSEDPYSINYYRNGTGTYLPNHIHLLANDGSEPTNTDDGPFFDQFFHARIGISVNVAWMTINSNNSGVPCTQGFIGKFGSNGYNSTLTRGVLVGNSESLDEERNCKIMLGGYCAPITNYPSSGATSIFTPAGSMFNQINNVQPAYVPGTASYGEPWPNGAVDRKYNPVITDPGLDFAGNPFPLNVGLRSYVRGISQEYGFDVLPNVIL